MFYMIIGAALLFGIIFGIFAILKSDKSCHDE